MANQHNLLLTNRFYEYYEDRNYQWPDNYEDEIK
jgi:hypothetical protein